MARGNEQRVWCCHATVSIPALYWRPFYSPPAHTHAHDAVNDQRLKKQNGCRIIAEDPGIKPVAENQSSDRALTPNEQPKPSQSPNLSWTENGDEALTISFCSFFPFSELEQFSEVRKDWAKIAVSRCAKLQIIQRRLTAVIATKGPHQQFSHHIQIEEYFGWSVYATAAELCITLSITAHCKPSAVRTYQRQVLKLH